MRCPCRCPGLFRVVAGAAIAFAAIAVTLFVIGLATDYWTDTPVEHSGLYEVCVRSRVGNTTEFEGGFKCQDWDLYLQIAEADEVSEQWAKSTRSDLSTCRSAAEVATVSALVTLLAHVFFCRLRCASNGYAVGASLVLALLSAFLAYMSVYYWVEYLTDTRISDLMTYSSSYGYSLYCMVFGAIAEIAMFIMVVITYFCARSDAMRYRYEEQLDDLQTI